MSRFLEETRTISFFHFYSYRQLLFWSQVHNLNSCEPSSVPFSLSSRGLNETYFYIHWNYKITQKFSVRSSNENDLRLRLDVLVQNDSLTQLSFSSRGGPLIFCVATSLRTTLCARYSSTSILHFLLMFFPFSGGCYISSKPFCIFSFYSVFSSIILFSLEGSTFRSVSSISSNVWSLFRLIKESVVWNLSSSVFTKKLRAGLGYLLTFWNCSNYTIYYT